MCVPSNGNEPENSVFVADGTPCRQTDGARDMCIAGKYLYLFVTQP